MVQTMDLVQVTVENLTHVCDPELFNYGKMRDSCAGFTHTFIGGRSYGAIADCGAGGWTLSFVISGRTKPINGVVKFNGLVADTTLLKKYVCYIGDDNDYSKKRFWNLKPRTIRQHILEGLKVNPYYTLEEIIELFGLTSTRIDRPIHLISYERWNASAAIGFAHNKKVFCFPWLNQSWIKRLKPRISEIIHVVKKSGSIVIIPTSKESNVRHLVDELIEVRDSTESIDE